MNPLSDTILRVALKPAGKAQLEGDGEQQWEAED